MSVYLVPVLENGGAVGSSITGIFTVSDNTPEVGDDIIFSFIPTSINFQYTANDYTLISGDDLILTAANTLTYQLQRNGVDIIGATDAVNTISNVNIDDIGSYTLLVTNSLTGRTKRFGPLSVVIAAFQIGNAIIGSTFKIA